MDLQAYYTEVLTLLQQRRKGIEVLHDAELCTVLKAMLDAIVARGQAKEGYKTMIDSLAPAVKKYEECLANGTPSPSYVSWLRRLQRMAQRIPRTWKQSEDAQAIRQTVDWVIWIRALLPCPTRSLL